MRNISTERTYSLGPYQNIKLYDEITDLPTGNTEVIALARQLQFLSLEIAFRKYIELQQQTQHMSIEESVNLLEELKVQTISELKQLLNPNPGE